MTTEKFSRFGLLHTAKHTNSKTFSSETRKQQENCEKKEKLSRQHNSDGVAIAPASRG
jgi:hypothetical protein